MAYATCLATVCWLYGTEHCQRKEGTFWYKFYRSKPMFWVEIDSFLVIYLVCGILEI